MIVAFYARLHWHEVPNWVRSEIVHKEGLVAKVTPHRFCVCASGAFLLYGHGIRLKESKTRRAPPRALR